MVVRVNEEVFTLTMPEAEYCLKVCELAAQGTSGSDLSNTFRKLHTRLEAELHKPVNLDVSLSAEEKNELVKAVMMTPEGTPLTYMLYGHVHNTHDERLVNEFIRITRSTMVKSARQTEEHPIPCNMINCFCMFSDYIPLTLDDWIRMDKGRRERTDPLQGHII